MRISAELTELIIAAPSPISVSVHGACVASTIAVNSAHASSPALISPPPP